LNPVILALPGNEALAAGLAEKLPGATGALMVRRFPDGESYVRIEAPVDGREVILACGLQEPDATDVSGALADAVRAFQLEIRPNSPLARACRP